MSEENELPRVFYISCETGCSCCSAEYNHYRGFYADKESAKRRIKAFYTGDYHPVSSQYYRYGRYTIFSTTVEALPDGRVIIGGSIITTNLVMIDVDGSGDANRYLEELDPPIDKMIEYINNKVVE